MRFHISAKDGVNVALVALALLAKKAQHVTAIDQDASAVERTRANAERNGLRNLEVRAGNALEALRNFDKEGRRFDTLVLDPPAFVKAHMYEPRYVDYVN